jgi:hypothetical protein
MSEPAPSPKGANGRDAGGRFAVGWRGGPGNPFAKRVAKLRATLFRSVNPADLRDVVGALLTSAKGGDVPAARELLQRLLGPPESIDLLARIDALETKLNQISDTRGNGWQRS